MGQGERTDLQSRNARNEVKVSAREFAELAGTTAPRVLRYLGAWDAAARDGLVPPAADLTPDYPPGGAVAPAPSACRPAGTVRRACGRPRR